MKSTNIPSALEHTLLRLPSILQVDHKGNSAMTSLERSVKVSEI